MTCLRSMFSTSFAVMQPVAISTVATCSNYSCKLSTNGLINRNRNNDHLLSFTENQQVVEEENVAILCLQALQW